MLRLAANIPLGLDVGHRDTVTIEQRVPEHPASKSARLEAIAAGDERSRR
jgi:hypothetical protein